MAEQTKISLSKDKLEIEGVQVTVTIYVGDWSRRVAISPIDYKVFKKWDKIYAKHIIDKLVEDIEYAIKENGNG